MRYALGLRPAFALALVPLVPLSFIAQDDGYSPPPQPPTLYATPTFIDDDVFLEIDVQEYVPNGTILLQAVIYAEQPVGAMTWPTSGNPPTTSQMVAMVPFTGSILVTTDVDGYDESDANYYWLWVELVYRNARGAVFSDHYMGAWLPTEPVPIELLQVDTLQLSSMVDFGQRGGMIVSVEYIGGGVEGYSIETIDVFAGDGTLQMQSVAASGAVAAPTPSLAPAMLSTAGPKSFEFDPSVEKVKKGFVEYDDDNSVVWILADVQLTKPAVDPLSGTPVLDANGNAVLEKHHKRFRTLITGKRPIGPERMWDVDGHGPPPATP